MKIFFTAAEYNPFHKGHKYHTDMMRKCGATHIAAVMSGNFTQRGEPALFDKFKRAEAAVKCGVDLVLELPLPWCLAPAERFAAGAVGIALSGGAADGFSFGCEAEDAEILSDAVLYIEKNGLADDFLGGRQERSYPSALSSMLPTEFAEALSSPNNILGVEYIKQLRRGNFSGEIFPVKRIGTPHDGVMTAGEYASASLIRAEITGGGEWRGFVPDRASDVFENLISEGSRLADIEVYERQAISILRSKPREYFSLLPFSAGGAGDRLFKAVRSCVRLSDIYDSVKTKRFTMSSVRRLVWCAVLGVPSDFCFKSPPYVKVLAFNDNGKDILRVISKKSEIPVVMKKSDANELDAFGKKVYELECVSTDLYNSFLVSPRPCGTEMTDNIFRYGG